MSTVDMDVVDAFTSMGIEQSKAVKAAVAINSRGDGDITVMKADIATLKIDVSMLKIDVALLKWMCGFMLAMTVAIFLKLFLHS